MNEKMKKILFISAAVVIVVIIIFFIFKNKNKKESETIIPTTEKPSDNIDKNQTSTEDLIASSRLIGGLPTSDDKLGINFSESEDNNLIEYISFLDFYKKNVDNIILNTQTLNIIDSNIYQRYHVHEF